MFRDRKDAALRLAEKLTQYKNGKNVIVLALPRGGVVTGYEIARQLNVPLDIMIVRKIGFPGQPEFAIGAVSETGTVVLNEPVISRYGVSGEYIRNELARQKDEISRRIKLYRKGKGIASLTDKIIILVDDGVATGATIKAAIATLKQEEINRLVVAVPVAPPETADELNRLADELICLETPLDFMAVGSYYRDFTQVSDETVIELLQALAEEKARSNIGD
ncbi:MAG: phosphoribosyltransferase [Nitrospirota bacterium]